MEWIYLLLAGIFEIGWPLGFKLSTLHPEWKTQAIALAIGSMVISMAFLLLAQRSIPISTAYAIWVGIGAVGTFLVGALVFKEPASLLRVSCVLLIVAGVIGLKFAK